MSVLSASTNIIVSNKTPFFLEVLLYAHQDTSFTLKKNFNPNVIPITQNPNPTLWSTFLSFFTGDYLEKIKLNIPSDENISIDVVLNSSLSIDFSIKDLKTTNREPGKMQITEDILGEKKIHIIYKDVKGVSYKKNGDVCINMDKPVKRDILVEPILKTQGFSDMQLKEVTNAKCLLHLEDLLEGREMTSSVVRDKKHKALSKPLTTSSSNTTTNTTPDTVTTTVPTADSDSDTTVNSNTNSETKSETKTNANQNSTELITETSIQLYHGTLLPNENSK